ncbi:GCK domain-containing protein [Quillaja saponaria]|uniref:GCK domain-containing protein n=1 Tax=Quillaja saponaria TaxID=32244 RepID=A0AAD7L9Z3_QUISA|nr:GCK domain-containing protein [Quillaja saponaria]
MSTSDSKSQASESESPQTQTSIQQFDTPVDKKVEEIVPDLSTQVPDDGREGEGVEDQEEVGECGFCLFMKAGGCRDSFIAWEECIEAVEKNKEDIVEKCVEVTGALKKCMEAHADYYEPILRAEKAAEEEAIKELEKEKEAEAEAASLSVEHNGGDLKVSRENEGLKDSEQQQASNDK